MANVCLMWNKSHKYSWCKKHNLLHMTVDRDFHSDETDTAKEEFSNLQILTVQLIKLTSAYLFE